MEDQYLWSAPDVGGILQLNLGDFNVHNMDDEHSG